MANPNHYFQASTVPTACAVLLLMVGRDIAQPDSLVRLTNLVIPSALKSELAHANNIPLEISPSMTFSLASAAIALPTVGNGIGFAGARISNAMRARRPLDEHKYCPRYLPPKAEISRKLNKLNKSVRSEKTVM